MFVIHKMRLNKFQSLPVLSPRALYARLGYKPSSQISKQTPDCIGDASIGQCNKLQAMALAERIVTTSEHFKHDPEHTDPMRRVDPAKL